MRYLCFRALLRAGFALAFRSLRILEIERMPDGPTVLLMAGRVRLMDCLMVVAGLEPTVQCWLQAELLKGWVARLLAWGLGVAVVGPAEGELSAAPAACFEALSRRASVLVGGNPAGAESTRAFPAATLAAALALQAEAATGGQLGISVVPVHTLRPLSWRGDAFVYLGDPVFAEDYGAERGEALSIQASRLQTALAAGCQRNPFSLPAGSVQHFLASLADLLREDVEEQWAGRREWQQTVEGFRLSEFVEDWCQETNLLDPAVLARLCQAMDAYDRLRRGYWLDQFEREGGVWFRSGLRRMLAAVESLAGFPLALYGLVNHFLALTVLAAAGLLGNRDRREPAAWAARALIVLGFYAAQIAGIEHALGRSAAGYYAPTLPLSGIYLWRYVRRLRRPGRGFTAGAWPWTGEWSLRRARQRILAQVNQHRDAYADWLGVPH
jgi:hypothetical protein